MVKDFPHSNNHISTEHVFCPKVILKFGLRKVFKINILSV